MAFVDQINDYVGNFTDIAALDKWLTTAAKKIIDLLPLDKAEKYTVDVVDAGSGIAVTGHRILRVHKGGYRARLVDAGLKTQLLPTSGSIYQATTTDPTYYIEHTKCYVLPSGGTVIAILYPTVVNTDTAILAFPLELENAVILYAAIQARIQQLSTLSQTTLGGLSLATTDVPATPLAPSFIYTNATGSIIVATTIGSLGIAPTYTKPTVSLTTAIAVLDLVAIIVPTVPTVPSFMYTDATGSTIVTTTIGSLGIAPTYTKPTLSLSPIPSDLVVGAIIPSSPSVPSYTYTDAVAASLITSIIDFTTITLPTFDSTAITYPSTAFPIAVSITPTNPGTPSFTHTDLIENIVIINNLILDLDTYFTALDDATTGYINGVQDVELANTKINEIQAKLAEVRTELEIGLQQAIKNADASNDIDKFNSTHQLQKEVQEYDAKLKRYAEELSFYRDEITKVREQYQLQQQGEIAKTKMQIDVQLAEFNEGLEVYRARVQKAIEDARLELQKNIEYARSVTDVEQKNKYNQLNKDISVYENTLKKYAEDLIKYQVETNTNIQQFRGNIDKWQVARQTEIQEYSANIQNELNEFNKEATVYQSTVQKAIEQARITLQETLRQAELTTDVSKQNKLQDLVKQIQEYEAKLKRYAEEVQSYNGQIGSKVGEYRANLDRFQLLRTTELQQYQSDIQNELNEFNKEAVEYQSTVQKAIEQARITIQEAIQQAQLTTDVDVKNKAENLAKQVQEYQSILQKYLNDLQSYTAQVNRAMGNYSTSIQRIVSQHQTMTRELEAMKQEYNEYLQLHLGVNYAKAS
uniref:Uncharacterized protein n=1 Tax=viral metagenome TaxID=1070528 RepID=A0A6M3XTM4_9ZZZZ